MTEEKHVLSSCQKKEGSTHTLLDSLLILVPFIEDQRTIDNTSTAIRSHEEIQRNYEKTPQWYSLTLVEKPDSYQTSLFKILQEKQKTRSWWR